MKIAYSKPFLFTSFLLAQILCRAQIENNKSVINDGGVIDSFSGWTNSENGVYYGSGSGVFNHKGPTERTFANFGFYEGSSGHIDRFQGPGGNPGDQEISGSNAPVFFDLEFVNGTESKIVVNNTEGIYVRSSLAFQNGITTTLRTIHHNASIRLEAGASYTGVLTDNRHVDGYVAKTGAGHFVFPVGNGTDLRTLEISDPGPEASICVAWIEGNPTHTTDPSDATAFHPVVSTKGVISIVSTAGQWDWIAVRAPENSITVKASIPDVSSFAQSEELRLVGWDGTGWIDLSKGAAATGSSENSFLTGTIEAGVSVSAIAIGKVTNALPVSLVSFEARSSSENSVELSWVTSVEYQNSHFLIEYSQDAVSFQKTGTVPGLGSGISEQKYHFVHRPENQEGVHYYRLRQVDIDGSEELSPIRSARLYFSPVSIYPNPASEWISVHLRDWEPADHVELLDNKGITLSVRPVTGVITHIDIRRLPAGVYWVRIRYNNNSVIHRKIVTGGKQP